MKNARIGITILIACGCMLLGCEGGTIIPMSSDTSPAEYSEAVDVSELPNVNELDENSIIASVNGLPVSDIEVEREMDDLFQQFKDRAFPEKTEEFNAKLWRQALENVINRRLFSYEADQEHILPDQNIVEDRISQIGHRFSSREKFRERLSHLGISEEKLREEIEHDLKIKALLEHHVDFVNEVSPDEIEEFYLANSENFQIPEQIQVRHILIAVSPDDSPAKREEKRGKILELRDQIQNGADFAQLAREHSDCNSKSNGGDLGYFKRGTMVKPFEDAAFDLKVGELSDVIETEYGFHLITPIDRQAASIVPLDQIREKVATFLRRQKRELAIREYLLQLRAKATIHYYR